MAAALIWILVLTRSSGGLHDPRTGWLAIALVPALALTRPWRFVSPLLLLAVVMTGAGAAVVLLISPTGWSQADSPADQLVGLVALVVSAAYARTPKRRLAVAATLMVALMLQFYEAWLPWWGSGDPGHLMVGTFYWHNQLAAWLVGTALVAGAVAVCGPRQLALPAMVVVPFADAAVVLSTSRASLALLVLGHIALIALAVCSRDRWSALARSLALPAAGAGLLWVLTSSFFFPAPVAVAGAPSAGSPPASGPSAGPGGDRSLTSLRTSGDERLLWNKAAINAWRKSPVAGDGFGSYLSTSDAELPTGALRSTFAHDAYAEALSSGGLVFGIPLLVLVLAMAVRAVTTLWRVLRPAAPDRGILAGAALATLALLAHSAVDFDWHYASLVVLLGVVAGLLFAAPGSTRVPRIGIALTALTGLVLALAATASLVEHHGRVGLGAHGTPTEVVTALLDSQVGPLYDDRLSRAALRAAMAPSPNGPDALTVTTQLAERALDGSRRGATLQPGVQVLRAELLALLGQPAKARRTAEDVVRRHGARSPYLYAPYAQVMYLVGSYEQARPAVTAAARAAQNPAVAWELVAVLERLDGSHPSADTSCAYADAVRRFGAPPPTAGVAPLPTPPRCPG